MTRNGGKNRDQIEFTSLDELVPEDHLVRKLENAIDWSFIYNTNFQLKQDIIQERAVIL